MKILLISASPRRETSQTFALATAVAEGTGAAVEVVHLRDHRIGFCRHCELCHREPLRCSVSDDAMELAGKMLAADGIILATPNYINQVTGSMKTLFDRTSHFIHCKRLLGKYVVGAVTSGSGRDEDVLAYLRYYALTCGAQFSGGVSSRAPVPDEVKKTAVDLGRTLRQDIQAGKEYPEQLAFIEEGRSHFRRLIQIRKDDWPGEYAYWKKQGWL